MAIKLFYIPNMNLLFEYINQCAGLVYLELRDKSFLNLKCGGEGEFFLKSIGAHTNGLTIITEKSEDAGLIVGALL